MQAVIFADRHGDELAPLCDRQCPALLRIASRPLLHHAIEELVAVGVDEIVLVVSQNAYEIEAYFDQGSMVGVNIRYLLSRGQENPAELLKRHACLLKAPFLAVRGDVLRHVSLDLFLRQAVLSDADVVEATLEGRPVGVSFISQWPADLQSLSWPMREAVSAGAQEVALPDGQVYALDSLQSFHAAALSAVDSSRSGEYAPGHEIETGLRAGKQSRVAAANRLHGSVVIGENCHVHQSVRIEGPCIIEDRCYIDRDVHLSNTIVLEDTYVGEGLSITNAIVSGDILIRVDRDTRLTIAEKHLLADTSREAGQVLQGLPDRLVALLALFLSLPLWIVAFLFSIAVSPTGPFHPVPIRVNRRTGQHSSLAGSRMLLLFATPIPLLRHLPMLLPVIGGELQLFGKTSLANPESPELQAPASSHRENVQGLLGPALLFLDRESPEEEVILSEIAFLSESGIRVFLSRLVAATRLLLTKRAWIPCCRASQGA